MCHTKMLWVWIHGIVFYCELERQATTISIPRTAMAILLLYWVYHPLNYYMFQFILTCYLVE